MDEIPYIHEDRPEIFGEDGERLAPSGLEGGSWKKKKNDNLMSNQQPHTTYFHVDLQSSTSVVVLEVFPSFLHSSKGLSEHLAKAASSRCKANAMKSDTYTKTAVQIRLVC